MNIYCHSKIVNWGSSFLNIEKKYYFCSIPYLPNLLRLHNNKVNFLLYNSFISLNHTELSNSTFGVMVKGTGLRKWETGSSIPVLEMKASRWLELVSHFQPYEECSAKSLLKRWLTNPWTCLGKDTLSTRPPQTQY